MTANFDYAALVQEEIPAEIARAKGERGGRVKDLLDGLMAGVYTKEEVEQQLSGSQYGRYRRQIEDIWAKRLQNLAAQWRKEKREQGGQVKTIWIYGTTGTGKTSLAKDYAKKVGQEYFVSGSSRDPFQGYAGEHTVIPPFRGGINSAGVFAMRNVTGQKFFGFMGKNTGTSLPRVGFTPREDPRMGVAADLADLLARALASRRVHGGRRCERIKPPPHTLTPMAWKVAGPPGFCPLAAPCIPLRLSMLSI